MKIIAGDEFGLLKCVDTSKKIVETKYGEMAKNNSVVAIDSLYTNKNNIMSILLSLLPKQTIGLSVSFLITIIELNSTFLFFKKSTLNSGSETTSCLLQSITLYLY